VDEPPPPVVRSPFNPSPLSRPRYRSLVLLGFLCPGDPLKPLFGRINLRSIERRLLVLSLPSFTPSLLLGPSTSLFSPPLSAVSG